MWERAHVGFGDTAREAQKPLHETMRLAEARLERHDVWKKFKGKRLGATELRASEREICL